MKSDGCQGINHMPADQVRGMIEQQSVNLLNMRGLPIDVLKRRYDLCDSCAEFVWMRSLLSAGMSALAQRYEMSAELTQSMFQQVNDVLQLCVDVANPPRIPDKQNGAYGNADSD